MEAPGVHLDVLFGVSGALGDHLDVLFFGVPGPLIAKKGPPNAKCKKASRKQRKCHFPGGPFVSFSVKMCNKCAPKPHLQQEWILGACCSPRGLQK